MPTMTTMTKGFQLAPAAVEELRRNFHGELIERSHPAYGEHRRLWNGSINRYPALIARCADTADVRAAVRFARRVGLPLAVRGGGHSFPGLSGCQRVADRQQQPKFDRRQQMNPDPPVDH
jgi:hypothetical protein